MEQTQGNVLLVRDFFQKNTDRPATTTEIMEFWKACTIEEREQFGTEIKALAHAA